jgi:hypothetical protein
VSHLITVVNRSRATLTLSSYTGGALSPDDGAYDGMAAAFCAAVADFSAIGAANFTIVRYLAGPPTTAVVCACRPGDRNRLGGRRHQPAAVHRQRCRADAGAGGPAGAAVGARVPPAAEPCQPSPPSRPR